MGYLAVSVCWFNPAAGVASDQLRSGADPLGAGIFPASFHFIFSLALIRQRWHKSKAGCKTRTNYNQRRKKRRCLI